MSVTAIGTRGLLCALTACLIAVGTAVAQSAPETVQFGYDAQGRLSTVTQADGSTRTYLYENSSYPNAMTGELDENSSRYSSWSYDSQGRATGETTGVAAGTLVYNPDGSVAVTWALGAARTFTFGRWGDRNLVTGISGSQCPTCVEPKETTYDLGGFVSSRTDYNGNVTRYTYDEARGLELSRTEAYGAPLARTITTQWHATYRLPVQIDEPGRRSTFNYDSSGNLLSQSVLDTATGESRTTSFTYNSFGQVLTVDGPRTDVNDVTTYAYYTCTTGGPCGELWKVTDALGHVTTFNTYNAQGRPLTITDSNGIVTSLTYDSRQRLISRTTAGEQTSFEYFPTGLLKKVTLPDASAIQYVYDAAHRLTEIIDTDGSRVVYTLDALGNHTAENIYDSQDTLARTHTRTFDALSRLASDINAAGTTDVTTSYSYDLNGNPTTVNAPLSRTTVSAFDELDRLKQVTDAAGGLIRYGYNALDQLVSVTDPRDLQTAYIYNAFGDLTAQSSPDTGVTQLTYDQAGNLATRTDARAKVATHRYDASNRLTEIQYADQTQTIEYDQGINGIGRMTNVSDSSGSTSYAYSATGRVVSKTQAIGSVSKTVSYGYNPAGQLASLVTPSGQLVSYGYMDGRVTSIEVNGTNVLEEVLYEPLGPTRGWTWGNGTLTVREHDADGRLMTIDSAGLTTYTFNADGTIQSKDDDSTFDNVSGTTTLAVSGASNRLTSTTGALVRTYTHDASGAITGNGTNTFEYNDAGRMVSSTTAGVTTNYALNALGQRVKKSNPSGTTLFVFDEAGRLLGEYDHTGALIQELVWLGDIPVATILTSTGGSGVGVFYVHTDHLGAPTKITRPADNVAIWRWDHDPFGNGAPSEDPDNNGLYLVFNLRFPGQYFDSETGLSYNYFRDYDPATGRYVESDPIGLEGGINTYAYAGSNPVSNVDPDGRLFFLAAPYAAPILLTGVYLACELSGACDSLRDGLRDILDPAEMAAPGNVADTKIKEDYEKYASGERLCGNTPQDRCAWLEANKSKYRADQVKATQKAWGCRRSRAGR